MDDHPDERLQDWVRSTVDDVDVLLSLPGDSMPPRGVGLYLLEFGEKPPARGASRPPLQLWLRYLVTAWAEAPEDAHNTLISLAFAAMDHHEFEVDLSQRSPEMWQALGLHPTPSFIIQVPLVRRRASEPVRHVRSPLQLRSAPAVVLEGTVLAGTTPVPGADVELPDLGSATRTDARGRFRFRSVPAAPASTRVRVRAKGFETTTRTKARPNRPIVINFNPWESEDAGISDA